MDSLALASRIDADTPETSLKPLISVVVPAYNEENYLPHVLASLQAQKTSVPFEILVVDNASRDKTSEIALQMGVRLVKEARPGLTFAREAGFQAARGEIIAYIDADSLAPEDWVEKIYRSFEEHPEAVAVRGHFRYTCQSKFHQWVLDFFHFTIVEKWLYPFFKGQVIAGTNFAVRRGSLEKIGGFNLKIQFYGEDVDIGNRLRKLGKIETMDCLVLSSDRRFREVGLGKTAVVYLLNSLWLCLFNRSFTESVPTTIQETSFDKPAA